MPPKLTKRESNQMKIITLLGELLRDEFDYDYDQRKTYLQKNGYCVECHRELFNCDCFEEEEESDEENDENEESDEK